MGYNIQLQRLRGRGHRRVQLYCFFLVWKLLNCLQLHVESLTTLIFSLPPVPAQQVADLLLVAVLEAPPFGQTLIVRRLGGRVQLNSSSSNLS